MRDPQDPAIFREEGRVPMLRGRTKILEADNFTSYVKDKVLAGMAEYAKENCPKKGTKCELAFYIHGGLNTNRGSVSRARQSICTNHKSKDPCDEQGDILHDQYPIFVVWNSSLPSSYGEHLLRVQRGRDIGAWGTLGAPFKFLADTGRAIARAPIVDYEMVSHDIRTIPGQRKRRTIGRDSEDYYRSLELDYSRFPGSSTYVNRCTSGTTLGQKLTAGIRYPLGFPVKLLATPVVDAFGTVSWDVMLRRIDLMFEEELLCDKQPPGHQDCNDQAGYYDVHPEPPHTRVRAGGLAKFLDYLRVWLAQSDMKDKWSITLVGHSMGAIVVNRMLDLYSDLPVDQVVYMASAATVRDTESSVRRLLESRNDAQIYHYVLHPIAELRERYKKTDLPFADLAPRGSLLVWIENYLAKSNTLEDRTAGRFTNITRSLAATPYEFKDNIHLSVSAVNSKADPRLPRKHTHFFQPKRKFWEQSFWKPDLDALCNTSPNP